MPMLHTVDFNGCKLDNFLLIYLDLMIYLDFFLIFAKNIDCEYNTHNLCFRAKVKKKCMPL